MKQRLLCLVCSFCAIVIVLQYVASAHAQTEDELIIFAASSLTDVFTELATEFENTTDTEILLNFAGSSTLSAQILQGAPADIFASANELQMQNIVSADLADETSVEVFAENELIIIVPQDNPAGIESVQDLANNNLLLVLASQSVPIRDYTDELLITLSDLYGESYSDAVRDNIVSEETNVRQIVARVSLGEADAGIIYRTDITSDVAELVQIIELPENASPRARYVIAPLLEAQSETAQAFIDFVLSSAGQDILLDYGFCPPQEPHSEVTVMPEITPELTSTIEETLQADEPATAC